MKKIISTLFVAVALLFAGVQSAQAQFSWGIKGGLNLQKADFDRSDLDTDNFTGFFVGPMAEFTIPIIGLGVDGALLYSQTGIKEEDETLKSHNLEIPINLKYSIGLGKLASVYAAAGPQFAFALSQDKLEWTDNIKNYSSKPFKKSQLSLNLGVGVKLISHLQAGVTYNIPLGDTAEYDVPTGVNDANEIIMDAIGAKNKTWKIHVAYIF
ncbi:MAG: porin family protein [Bacteroidaceae bacterium]|nr:porin family protein [Bacteroidaceae bacterium]